MRSAGLGWGVWGLPVDIGSCGPSGASPVTGRADFGRRRRGHDHASTVCGRWLPVPVEAHGEWRLRPVRPRAADDVLRRFRQPARAVARRWLAGLGTGNGLDSGASVSEGAMARLFGTGRDPVSGRALGRPYPTYLPVRDRIAVRVASLPEELAGAGRTSAIEAITRSELVRPRHTAVAGFDMTFTPPKSVSALWALGDRRTQTEVLAAHRAAVEDSLSFFEKAALFTRTGAAGCEQRPTRGALAGAFDHWDSRAGDPNLHTHVVVANKVQSPDGRWLSVDSRALHHAVVTVSELYDDLLADELARRLPVSWSWRHRGVRRSPGFELDGTDDGLMVEFSTRTTQIDAAMTATISDFYASHGRAPNRIEVSRLRQQVTRATRPDKRVRPLAELVEAWRGRASDRTGRTPEALTADVLSRSRAEPMTASQVPQAVIDRLACHTVEQVMERRSTWTRWNVLAETARATRGLRMATPADRIELLDRVSDAALRRCVSLEPPEPFTSSEEYQRPEGTSVFTRPGEARYTHADVLAAERRLLAAATNAAVMPGATPRRPAVDLHAPLRRVDGRAVTLAEDQIAAIRSIRSSQRRVDVLVGPAGTGKTTTLAGLKADWEAEHGRGSVLGLAPSSTAAAELAGALGIACENTAKWLHESTGKGAQLRADYLSHLAAERHETTRVDLRRLRTIDTAISHLTSEQQRWTMRAGQLVIVDEASLAGTMSLDALTAQASAAGAKLLLVGDHAQLSAVDAGGAFNLLAERAEPATLTSLWRFTHQWEAHATRALRAGLRSVLDAYEEHERITAGPAEAMCEAAYTAWQAHTENGVAAILLAADARTVASLNTRAHNDRVTDGLVAPDGVSTTDGAVLGVGDHVVTRANNRRLRTGDGHVRNGDLWTVTATSGDGSLTVARLARGGAGEPPPSVVELPRDYVAEHVDLAYATTTHRAQGITVDHAHVLAAPGMTRENLYVAMTRGRDDNHVYVAVDEVDPTCDYLPDTHATPDGHDVLATILATSGAELSAIQTIAARQNVATSLKRLGPIRDTILADASAPRWIEALRHAGLTDTQIDAITVSPSCGSLFTALERGATIHPRMNEVVDALVAGPQFEDPDESDRDLAAALRRRVSGWLSTQVEDPHALRTYPDTSHLSPGAQETLRRVEELIAARIDALTDHAIADPPAWVVELGPEPDDVADRRAWRARIAATVSHDDLVNGPTSTLAYTDQPGGTPLAHMNELQRGMTP
ncbi:MobF family relaxase [Cellulomonas sp. NPDC055163]